MKQTTTVGNRPTALSHKSTATHQKRTWFNTAAETNCCWRVILNEKCWCLAQLDITQKTRRPENRKKEKKKKHHGTRVSVCRVQLVRFVNHWHWHWQHTLHLPVSKKKGKGKERCKCSTSRPTLGNTAQRETEQGAGVCQPKKTLLRSRYCHSTQHSQFQAQHTSIQIIFSRHYTLHYTTLPL